jgi:hypothetical protein
MKPQDVNLNSNAQVYIRAARMVICDLMSVNATGMLPDIGYSVRSTCREDVHACLRDKGRFDS